MSWAVWITGRPGSGKSTLARAAAARLAGLGTPATVLELDRIRRVLTPAPTYSDAEREIVYRSLVFMAVALTEAGVPVLIDATAHRRAWRDLARASIARFAEVQLDCPLELAQAREEMRTPGAAPLDIYAGATRPGATVPGVNVPYEPALAPDLSLDTGVMDVATAADRIAGLALLLQDGESLLPEAAGAGEEPGAVIWITGPPGSGKTTLARRLVAALAAEGVRARLLEWAALRALVLAGPAGGDAAEEIAHRALAYIAKLLAEAGLTVVVDATAPRRAWRRLARELTATFAEVQLVCPAAICLDRERAERWSRHPGTGGPDVVPDYEYADNPELLLDTATRGEWATTDDLLRLARRLLRRRVAGRELSG